MCYIVIHSYPMLHAVTVSCLHAGLAGAAGHADAGGSGLEQGKLHDAVLHADPESNGPYQTDMVPEEAAPVPEVASLQSDVVNHELPAPFYALSGSTLPPQGMLQFFLMFARQQQVALSNREDMLSWCFAYVTSAANVPQCA